VADPAHDELFISQGSSSLNNIIVTNLQGEKVATIGGQDGVMGIALSQDGSTLYAALSGDHAVSAISTSTLEQTASYPIGDGNTPQDVAVQAGKVWVSYNTGVDGEAAIGDINLTASPPTFETQAATSGCLVGQPCWYSAPELAADSDDSGVLVAMEPGQDPAEDASFDVLTDPITLTALDEDDIGCGDAGDLAVVPGGAEFLLACQASPTSGAPEYDTANLSEQGSYAVVSPNAVATDASGDVAIGAVAAGGGSAIYIYQPGSETPLNTVTLGPFGASAARGLAWSPNGSQLFAVLTTNPVTASQVTYGLDVLDSPTQAPSQLSLSGPSSITYGQSVTLSGSLTAASGSPALPAGTPVTIVRGTGGSWPDKTWTVATGTDGSFSLTDTPPNAGEFTYLASYGGSPAAGPGTSALLTLTVSKAQPSLTLTAGPAVDNYGSSIVVRAHLTPADTNGTLTIDGQTAGSTVYKMLSGGSVNAEGNFTVPVAATESTHFIALFSGDDNYLPATAAADIAVRAGVSATLGGYYQSRRIGHATYLVYHRRNAMKVDVAVRPNKAGECVTFQTDEYLKGAWHAGAVTGCHTLGTGSTLTVSLSLRDTSVGARYRIRVRYAGDTSNLGANSSWQHFIVER
jgi:hypothetical protein